MNAPAPLLSADLKQRVTIMRDNRVDNGRGGRKSRDGEEPWLPVADVWAQCIALRGGEALSNLVQNATQLWKVTIRARKGLDPTMRIRWSDPITGAVDGNIRSIALNERRDGIVMTVESGRG